MMWAYAGLTRGVGGGQVLSLGGIIHYANDRVENTGRHPKKPKPRAHPFSLAGNEAVETEVGLPIAEVEAEGRLDDMLNSLSEGVKITPVKTPRTFHGKLLHERAGKRVNKLAPTLLICPMSVVGNWQMEVERFAPSLKVMVHHGADRHRGKIFARAAKKHDLVGHQHLRIGASG